TEPQSALDSEDRCTEPARACTVHVSASQRSEPDPAGAAPAAFQVASADGTVAYFTSSEKLTEDANTGPEQESARIGRADVTGEEATSKEDAFLTVKGAGLATSPDGKYLYWADPVDHAIGRAELTETGPANFEPEYIDPGATEFVTHPQLEPGIKHSAASTPRYVAVDDEYVYWTNTGPLGEQAVLGETQEPLE